MRARCSKCKDIFYPATLDATLCSLCGGTVNSSVQMEQAVRDRELAREANRLDSVDQFAPNDYGVVTKPKRKRRTKAEIAADNAKAAAADRTGSAVGENTGVAPAATVEELMAEYEDNMVSRVEGIVMVNTSDGAVSFDPANYETMLELRADIEAALNH